MLDKLLSGKDCAECKWCCKFNDEDISEKPQIFKETVDYIRKNFPDAALTKGEEDVFYFDMKKSYCKEEKEEQYTCPMLRDGEGCALGEERMLDCKIWPFRVMNCAEGIAITLSEECKVMNGKTDQELIEELIGRGTAKIIFQAAERRPVMIKPYRVDHRIILYQDDFWNERHHTNN